MAEAWLDWLWLLLSDSFGCFYVCDLDIRSEDIDGRNLWVAMIAALIEEFVDEDEVLSAILFIKSAAKISTKHVDHLIDELKY